MNTQQKYAKGKLFAGAAMATIAAVVLFLLGCPTGPGPDRPNPGPGPIPPAVGMPGKPVITAMQDGFDFTDDVDLSSPTAVTAAVDDPDKKIPVISLTWTGSNTHHYNLFWSDEAVRPANPQVANIRDTVYFIREGLQPDTRYFVWVEAVNANGTSVSDHRDRTTRDDTIERGDYPRNIRVEPGSGTLTVWWDLADRVGWHEIYFAPVGEINKVDVYRQTGFPTDGPWTGRAYHADAQLYPFMSPLPAAAGSWAGYHIAKYDGVHPDTRPMIGVESFGEDREIPITPAAGAFPYLFESWWEGDDPQGGLGRLVPYQILHENFANAVPWDDVSGRGGAPGTPIRHYRNHVTITGLTNGTQYEVWIRVPNVNGERGYGYIVGTPGSSGLPAPQNITLTIPEGTTRNLDISWDSVSGATAYRVYFSQFNEAPGPRTPFDRIASTGEAKYTVGRVGLLPGTEYFVWVVAELNSVAGEIGSAVSGSTGMPPLTGVMREKLDANGNTVKTLVYIEVNDHNPLNAGSYILEDGTFLFDYVVIFAANIRNRDCTPETHKHGCTKTGVHLHLNENVRHILENRTRYIVPLQEKGINVLLGLLGDWDGIGFGSMTDEQVATFIEDVRRDVELYQLDGIDFDDEWSNKMMWEEWPNSSTPPATAVAVYPFHSFGWPFVVHAYRDPAMGIEPGNVRTLTTQAELDALGADLSRMWLQGGRTLYRTITEARRSMPDTVITLYEFNKGRWITPNMAPVNAGIYGPGALGSEGPTVEVTRESLASLVDLAMQPWYNQWHGESANGLPRSIYSPLAIDVGGHAYSGQNGSPNPTFPGEEAGARPLSISTVAQRFMDASDAGNPYGAMFFYGLNPSGQLLRLNPNAPADRTKEDYLSYLTETVFGQRVLLTAEGGNFLKDW